MGDRQRAREYFQKWLQTDRDSLSDCLACDQNHRVDAFAYFGQFDEAFETAKPLLDGRMTCRTMPQVTYATLMLPAIKSEHTKIAERLFNEGYHLISGRANFLREAAQHLYYLIWIDRLDEALDCFWTHQPIANEVMVDSQKIEFYHAAACLFQAMGSVRVKLQDAKSLPKNYCNSEAVAASELRKWTNNEANKIAMAFDARNENSYWTDRLAETENLVLRSNR